MPVRHHRAASYVLAGIGAVLAIAIADLFFDPGSNFSGTCAVAPFIPAVAASPRATAWVGAFAFAVAMALRSPARNASRARIAYFSS